MTELLTNISTHPIDLANGAVLAPGEQVEGASPGNEAAVRAGVLAVTKPAADDEAERPAKARHVAKETSS